MRLSMTVAVVFLLVGLLKTTAPAQKKQPPPPLNRNSSVFDNVDSLAKAGLGNARVGLSHGGLKGDKYVFAPGFKFIDFKDCTLTLGNEGATFIAPSRSSSIPRFDVQMKIFLNDLSPTKGKVEHLLFRDPKKAQLLGSWRTKFIHKGLFSLLTNAIELSFSRPGEQTNPGPWFDDNVAFAFDSKEMSESFDAAFRRAITLCNQK